MSRQHNLLCNPRIIPLVCPVCVQARSQANSLQGIRLVCPHITPRSNLRNSQLQDQLRGQPASLHPFLQNSRRACPQISPLQFRPHYRRCSQVIYQHHVHQQCPAMCRLCSLRVNLPANQVGFLQRYQQYAQQGNQHHSLLCNLP